MVFSTPFAYPQDLFNLLDDAAALSQRGTKRGFSPNFDIYETPESYVLEGELPGLHDKSALQIEFADQNSPTLVVRGNIKRSFSSTAAQDKGKEKSDETAAAAETGEKKEQAEQSKPRSWLSERSVGDFERSFRFPKPVDQDAVTAALEHGVLTITVPKRVPVKKRVEVQ